MSAVGKKRKIDKDTLVSTSESDKSTSISRRKKTKTNKSEVVSSNGSTISKSSSSDASAIENYQPLSLSEIRSKITQLSARVPNVPSEGIDPEDRPAIRSWATQMQAVIEEFNLLLCCVSAATYKWGSDRSGAADQNLTVLSSELGNAQDQISSSVTPRLSNVLAPVVDLVVKKVVTTKDSDTGEEVRVNHYVREEVDPNFIKLCGGILCRNATMLRQVVLTNFHKIITCIDDYVKATKKDTQNDGNIFAY